MDNWSILTQNSHIDFVPGLVSKLNFLYIQVD